MGRAGQVHGRLKPSGALAHPVPPLLLATQAAPLLVLATALFTSSSYTAALEAAADKGARAHSAPRSKAVNRQLFGTTNGQLTQLRAGWTLQTGLGQPPRADTP